MGQYYVYPPHQRHCGSSSTHSLQVVPPVQQDRDPQTDDAVQKYMCSRQCQCHCGSRTSLPPLDAAVESISRNRSSSESHVAGVSLLQQPRSSTHPPDPGQPPPSSPVQDSISHWVCFQSSERDLEAVQGRRHCVRRHCVTTSRPQYMYLRRHYNRRQCQYFRRLYVNTPDIPTSDATMSDTTTSPCQTSQRHTSQRQTSLLQQTAPVSALGSITGRRWTHPFLLQTLRPHIQVRITLGTGRSVVMAGIISTLDIST